MKTLSDIKVGDKVLFIGAGVPQGKLTVVRITATRIFTKSSAWRKIDGYRVGSRSAWDHDYITVEEEK